MSQDLLRLPSVSALLIALALALAWPASEPRAAWELRHQSITAQSVANGALLVADFDGDGRDDFLALSSQSLLVGGCTFEGACSIKQQMVLEVQPYFPRVLLARDSGRVSVLVLHDEFLVEYAGWPLREVRRVPLPLANTTVATGDLDGDGRGELLIGSGVLTAYDLATMQVKWSLVSPGWTFLLAQLDADPALEIVVDGSSSSTVIDGATHLVDWTAPLPFHRPLVAGRFGTSGTSGFLAATSQGLQAFQSTPYAPSWQLSTSSGVNAVAVFDLDDDGNDELLLAKTAEALQVYAAATGNPIGPELADSAGAAAVAGAQLDGDRSAEIVYARPTITVLDGVDRSVRMQLPADTGNVSAVARGDVDADGSEEWVIASSQQHGRVRIVDAGTNSEEWRSPDVLSSADLYYMEFRDVVLAQVDADAALEIVLVGKSNFLSGRILVLDGATREIELLIEEKIVDREEPLDAHLADVAGDAAPELLLLARGSGGTFVHAISLFDGRELWRSPVINELWMESGKLVSMQTDADPALELLGATRLSLSAVDAATRAVEWRFDSPSPAQPITAMAVRDADGQPELLLGLGNSLVRLDPMTRAERGRTYIGAPILAIEVLPGEPQWALVAADGRLHHVDVEAGMVLGSSSRLGTALALQGHVAPAASGPREFSILAGSDIGYFEALLDRDAVFGNGFE
jgi:hypothetical protein